jgi:hypothetical protein
LNFLPSASTGEYQSTHSNIFRRIFSFPLMLAGVLTMLGTLTVRARLSDPDMWWQLKTGQIIWTTHTIPTNDLFSYTTNHQPLIPHEWLSQVLIYSAYHWGGYAGLMLWLYFFTSALLVVGYILCALYSGNSKTAFAGALIIWFFSTTVLAIRPQMVGYLLLVIELLLVHLGSTRSPRWFFALPPLFALWVNCHGSFMFGLFVLGIFLLCSFFDLQAGSLVSSRWDFARQKILMLAILFSIAALFLNPIGLKQVLYPVNTLFHQPIGLSQIEEWQPLRMSDPRGFVLFGILLCIFLLLVTRRSKLYLNELLLLIAGTVFAISHLRMTVLFGIFAAPLFSRLLSTSWDEYDAQRDHPLANLSLVVVAALMAIRSFPNRQDIAKQIDTGNPVKAVQFIKGSHLSGHMLNAYNYGGYLIWALPEHPDFIDGRADVFEWSGMLQEFLRWAMLEEDPNILLNKYNVDFCLLERQSAIAHVLPLMRNWKLVYSDDESVVFVRSDP